MSISRYNFSKREFPSLRVSSFVYGYTYSHQKQPPVVFCKKMVFCKKRFCKKRWCSVKRGVPKDFHKFHSKTPELRSLSNKVEEQVEVLKNICKRLLLSNQGGLNKKEIQLNHCNIFSIFISTELYLYA